MKQIQKTILVVLSITIILLSLPSAGIALHSAVCEVSDISELKHEKNHFEGPFTTVNESLFPEKYPEFLKQVYIVFRQAELLKKLNASDREPIVQGQEKERQEFFRGIVEHDEWKVKQLCWQFLFCNSFILSPIF